MQVQVSPRYTFSIEGLGPLPTKVALQEECDRLWQYAPHTPQALQQMAERLALAARAKATLTYAALVRGIAFQAPTRNMGLPYRPPFGEGVVIRSADLALVDECLTYLSLHSFKGGDVIASALVTAHGHAGPNSEFLRLVRCIRGSSLKLFGDRDVWQRELERLYSFFSK